MTEPEDTAQHYRKRAEEARAVAASISGESERQAMLRIAKSYEALALQAERPPKGRL